MSTLYVEEYTGVPVQNGQPLQLASAGFKAAQKVTIGASSTQCTNAFSAFSRYIEIHADAECYYDTGADPTATTSSRHLQQGERIALSIAGGDKIACIQV